ncbi:MAG: hypothetical protein ABFD49_09545 [Armatimonadota bacterium]|nr:hypothetical protein [bacterium]
MNSESVVPKWMLIAALAGFAIAGGFILWAISASKDPGAATPNPISPADTSVMGTHAREEIAPPSGIVPSIPLSLPDLRKRSATAKVTVTPLPPDPQGKSAGNAGHRAGPGAMRDMFPFGKAVSDFAEPAGSVKRAPAAPVELFPEFSYAGKQWWYTGKTVSGNRLEMTPAGFSLDERRVFALAGSDEAASVLFVQSATNPYRYAVYRTNGTNG